MGARPVISQDKDPSDPVDLKIPFTQPTPLP